VRDGMTLQCCVSSSSSSRGQHCLLAAAWSLKLHFGRQIDNLSCCVALTRAAATAAAAAASGREESSPLQAGVTLLNPCVALTGTDWSVCSLKL
jgi:hypothetical protein